MNYTNVFGSQTIPSVGTAYRAIPLPASVTLNWIYNYSGSDFIAALNDVTPTANGFSITLPPANGTGAGQDLLFNNPSSFTYTILANDGTVLATVAPGIMKYLYLSDGSTIAGIWRVVTFGTGTSAADASALVGAGLLVLSSTLNLNIPVLGWGSTYTVTLADRARVLSMTGGSSTINLASVSSLPNGFFFGVHNSSTGLNTITPNGSETIDSATSVILNPGESALLFNSGTSVGWITVGLGRSTQFQFTKLIKDITAGGTFTLTNVEAANKILQFIGSPTVVSTVIVPNTVAIYYIQCTFTGSSSLVIKTASGAGVTLLTNAQTILYCDGAIVTAAQSVTLTGALSATDGTAAAPSISFSAEPTTGFNRLGTGTVGISGSGATVASFSPTIAYVVAKLGIGKTVPTLALDVIGSGNFTGTVSVPTGASGFQVPCYSDIAGFFAPISTTVKSVTGTAPVVSSGGLNPAISIVQSSTSVSGYLSSTDWNTFNGKQASLGYTPWNPTVTAGGTLTPPSGVIEIGRYIDFHGTTSANDWDVRLDCGATPGTNGAGTLTIAATGGATFNGPTTSTSSIGSGAGPAITSNSTDSGNLKIKLSDNGTVRGYIAATSGYSFASINAGNSLYTFTADQSGNTSNPGNSSVGGALTAIGNVTGNILSGLKLSITQTGSNTADLSLTGGGSTTPTKAIRSNGGTGNLEFINNAYSAVIATLTDTGSFSANAIYSPSITQTSDERLKTNWQPLPKDFVMNLATVKHGVYERLGTGNIQAGVSAQSIQKVLPEVVHTDENGILSVEYGNAALVACIALAKEVVSLKLRLFELESK